MADELVEPAQQGQVVVSGLAEAEARVDPDLADARRFGHAATRSARWRDDLVDDVVVVGAPAAWWPASPCMCMATQPTPSSAATSPQRRRDVVDQRGAGCDGGARDLGLGGCRSRRRTSPASASITGSTRRSSSSSGTGSAPGRVDSPPTSSDRRALVDQTMPVRDRRVGLETNDRRRRTSRA